MTPASGLALLLAEEFDARPPPLALAARRAAAGGEAHAKARPPGDAEAAASRQALATACADLAAGLTEALAALDAALAEAAGALARAMVAALATALPCWQQLLGPAVCGEVATTLLAALGEAVSPRLAVAPRDAAALRALLPPRIALDPDPAMAPGALRLAWNSGRASRDPVAIWNDIETVLTAAMEPPPRPRDAPAAGVPTDSMPTDSETE